MNPTIFRAVAVGAVLATAAACSDTADPVPAVPTGTISPALTAPADAPSTTTRAATATAAMPTSTTALATADLDAAAAAWTDAWAVAGRPDQPHDESVDATAAAVLDTFLRSDNAPTRTFIHAPTVTDNGDGTFEISDCLLSMPPIGAQAAVWFTGTVTIADNGTHRISDVAGRSLRGCVPREVAEAAIAGYEDYWDAAVEYWVPADPTSPLIGQTMTGDHLAAVTELVAGHAERGLELRGRPTTHPEVIEYRSPTEVTILDCQRVDQGRGLFDSGTGERLPDIPPIVDGQLDVRSADMVFEDGRWKVAGRQGQVDVECDFAPTAYGVPVA